MTKKPMKPIIANPIAVAKAIFWNSEKEIIFNHASIYIAPGTVGGQ